MKFLVLLLRSIGIAYIRYTDPPNELNRKEDVEFFVKGLYAKVLIQDRKYVEQLAEHLNVKL